MYTYINTHITHMYVNSMNYLEIFEFPVLTLCILGGSVGLKEM